MLSFNLEHAPHILIVDDDKRLRDLIARFLREHNYRVTIAANSSEADQKQAFLIFDAMVLDVMMPGENGFEYTRRLRCNNSQIPVLMLTARSETQDRIEGLEAGVDDYLSKPFEPRELILRLNNIIKRKGEQIQQSKEILSVVFERFTFDIGRGELLSNNEIFRLTERERDILTILAKKANENVPREHLSPSHESLNERTIDVQINRLRRKIEKDPANPLYLQTVRGIGYRLRVDEIKQ